MGLGRRRTHLAALCLAGAALAGGCGSSGAATGRAIPAGVATTLAARADQIAADVDSGGCDQAMAEARSLEGDLAGVNADPAVRAEALSRAARLVATINCPPPTTTTTTAAPAPAPHEPPGPGPGHDKGKKDGHGPAHDD